MVKYLIRRLLQLVVVTFVISVLTFMLVHLLPGDPTEQILGANDTAANRLILLKQLGLNYPLWRQYLTWVGAVFQGNLGTSYLNHQSVTHIIATGAPIDLELIIISQVIAFAIAIPLALVTSRKPNKALDNISTTSTFGLLALPPFVVAPILVAVFAVGLGWFPATGYTPITQSLSQNIHEMILPSVAITAGSIAVYYRLLRSDLISTLQQDFITMARSKGLSGRRIMWRHAFRPSSFSLLAGAGINIGALIAGTFVVELLFVLPGIGYALVQAVEQRDYLVVQGIALVVAVAYVILQFVIDFIFTIVDPRVVRE
jgi:peptide/nickel transport system permease protein